MNENTKNNDLVRLEYHEKTGSFHFEDDFNHTEGIFGWKTIARRVSIEDAMRFVCSVNEIRERGVGAVYNPTFDEVRDYWFIFMSANIAGQSDNEQ